MENGRCRVHGGLSPKPGITHPRFSHGRYSKDLKGVGDWLQAMREDPQLLETKDAVALQKYAAMLAKIVVDQSDELDPELVKILAGTSKYLSDTIKTHWALEFSAEKSIPASRVDSILAGVAFIMEDEFGTALARKAMWRVDTELLDGALGVAKPE